MIYLLFGTDTYRSREKLKEIIAGYREKNGAHAEVRRFDCETDSISLLRPLLVSRSLFVQKRLVIVLRPFSSAIDAEAFWGHVSPLRESPDVAIVLWDGGLGTTERKKIEKFMSLIAKAQEFKPLSPDAVKHFIYQEAKKRSLSLSAQTVTELLSHGSDLWKISNELAKREVSAKQVGESAAAVPEVSLFDVGDNFFGDPAAGTKHVLTFLSQGQDGLGLFSYLANHTRTMLAVKTAEEEKSSLPPALGIHPFVARKTAARARHISAHEAAGHLKKFFYEDRKIKTGLTKPHESLMGIIFSEKTQNPSGPGLLRENRPRSS